MKQELEKVQRRTFLEKNTYGKEGWQFVVEPFPALSRLYLGDKGSHLKSQAADVTPGPPRSTDKDLYSPSSLSDSHNSQFYSAQQIFIRSLWCNTMKDG